MKKSILTFSLLAASLIFSSCTSNKADVAKKLPEKINMTKWLYNEVDDVFYQTGIVYVANPADEKYENLGVFVPGKFFTAKDNGDGTWTASVNKNAKVASYTAKTAPFATPVDTGGYAACEPPSKYTSAAKNYTDAGFIFVYTGARGRDHGAPAGVTDFKAAIRFIRYNKDLLPGDTDRYFTYGMSGGGAQSALIGATGDAKDYEPYLKAIGAVMDESDAIMGSMDWCPITNLSSANEAYEWELGLSRSGLDSQTKALSDGLAIEFAKYFNSLDLKDENGNLLTLEQSQDGLYHAGSYWDYLKTVVEKSLNNFLSDTKWPYSSKAQEAALGSEQLDQSKKMGMFRPGRNNGGNPGQNFEAFDNIKRSSSENKLDLSASYNSAEEYIAALNANGTWVYYDKNTNTAKISSLEDFYKAVKPATKSVGAFDDLEKAQGENTLFGYGDKNGVHWDSVMAKVLKSIGSSKTGEYEEDLAKKDALKNSVSSRVMLYDPMYFLSPAFGGYKTSKAAKFWRVRSGLFQGDTALSTELDYSLALMAYPGVKSVDFETVWGLGHREAERSGEAHANFIAWVNECLK